MEWKGSTDNPKVAMGSPRSADLYFFLVNRIGAPADPWADGTGELAGLGDPAFMSPES